jgi:predicted small lipoprotein YifL
MRPIIALSFMVLLLSACGQTGPLYLPGHDPHDKSAGKPVPEADKNSAEETAPAKQEGL